MKERCLGAALVWLGLFRTGACGRVQGVQPQSLKRRIGSCSSEPGRLISCKVSKVVGRSYSSKQLIGRLMGP